LQFDASVWAPVLTALFTLANTALLVFSARHTREIHRKVNGLYMQTLADAEERGRVSALTSGASALKPTGDPPDAAPR
jgi:hypothetical protein